MNSVTATKKRLTIVLDTNVLISAMLFGGIPREILFLVLSGEVKTVTSPVLLSELTDILHKKFAGYGKISQIFEKSFREHLKIVNPKKQIKICRDKTDNCVLEAAIEGKANYIVTGDKDLLSLKKYKNVLIVLPSKFYSEFSLIPVN